MVQNSIIYSCGHKAPETPSILKKVKRALSNKGKEPKDIEIKLNACLVEIEIEDATEKGQKTGHIEIAATGKAKDDSWFDEKAEKQKIEIDFLRNRMDKLVNKEFQAKNRAEQVSEN